MYIYLATWTLRALGSQISVNQEVLANSWVRSAAVDLDPNFDSQALCCSCLFHSEQLLGRNQQERTVWQEARHELAFAQTIDSARGLLWTDSALVYAIRP